MTTDWFRRKRAQRLESSRFQHFYGYSVVKCIRNMPRIFENNIFRKCSRAFWKMEGRGGEQRGRDRETETETETERESAERRREKGRAWGVPLSFSSSFPSFIPSFLASFRPILRGQLVVSVPVSPVIVSRGGEGCRQTPHRVSRGLS